MNAAHNCLELPLLRQQRITARLLGRSTTCPVRVCIVVEIFVRTSARLIIVISIRHSIGGDQCRWLQSAKTSTPSHRFNWLLASTRSAPLSRRKSVWTEQASTKVAARTVAMISLPLWNCCQLPLLSMPQRPMPMPQMPLSSVSL